MTQTPPTKAPHLLDDLESIRALLGDQDPPVLSDTLDPNSIPLLSEVVETESVAAQPEVEPREPAVRTAFRTLAERHLDHELRTAAQLILQNVIDDFVPQIEAELRRRLESRAEHLIKNHRP
jgi:hypothetical protein